MQKWLDNNNPLMHSTHNEGNSVISYRFIRISVPLYFCYSNVASVG